MEQLAISGACDLVDRHDAWMRQFGIRLQPSFEPLENPRVDVVEDLDRRRPPIREVRRHVDRRRGTWREPPDQPVTGRADGWGLADVHGRGRRGLRRTIGLARAPRNVRCGCDTASCRRAICGPWSGLATMKATVAIDLPFRGGFQVKLQPR